LKWCDSPFYSMATSTTVEIDEQGRLTVPKPVREALEIEGTEALVELEIDVKKRKEAAE
jgi:AbrB family looped-hinge helix DNA binding protein